MKCEHCGRNDATFYYRSNVNGCVSETHLCEDCAEQLGYRTELGGVWNDLFSFLPRAAGGEGFFAESSFTPSARRALRVLPEEGMEKPLLTQQERQAYREQREKNTLQIALKEAVANEDYEQAAKLRDELKHLEN